MKKALCLLMILLLAFAAGCSDGGEGEGSSEATGAETTRSDEKSEATAAVKATESAATEKTSSADFSAEKNSAVSALKNRLADAREGLPDIAPALMLSYDTSAIQLSNTAYVYDNALAAMAFIAEDMKDEAKDILDSFVFAVENDRYKPGRIRNAYAAGDIRYESGGKVTAKLPGWSDGGWHEDASQVGSNVGNTSFAVLAMLQYDKTYGTSDYLDTALALIDWVIENCSTDSEGFSGGFEGWPEEDKETRLDYKSTEHNIDAYAAFTQLYKLTGDERYNKAAESALSFVKAMYDSNRGLIRTGADGSGKINEGVVVLDAQVWSALALGGEFTPYESALKIVADMKTSEGGYPFCEENKNGGWWAEGTAFTALMYRLRGEGSVYDSAMKALGGIQLDSGLFPAATVDNLSTGIQLSDGSDWLYRDDPHIAPTAWFVMAADGFNPYSFSG